MHLKNKFIILALSLSAVFANPIYAQQTSKQDIEFNSKLNAFDINIKQGNTTIKGIYAHLTKKDGKWILNSFSTERPKVVKFDAEEVLVFSEDFKLVQPDFRDFSWAKTDEFSCMSGALRPNAINHRSDYNPCDSSLTKVSSYEIGTNAFLAVFSFGISVATGTTSSKMLVDPAKVTAIIEESQLMQKIQEIKNDKWLNRYRNQFKSIKTPKDIDDFISNYANHDPENLLSQAEAQRELIWLKQYRRKFDTIDSETDIDAFTQTYANKDPENLLSGAEAKREKIIQMNIDRARAREAESKANQIHQRQAQQQEAQRKENRLHMVKVIGAKICQTLLNSSYNEDQGFAVYGQQVYKNVFGTVTLTGYTENVADERLQIRVGGINFSGPKNISLSSFEYGGVQLKSNSVFWEYASLWTPC